ncbi:hypothetical protein NDN13_12555 [Acinetobacter sp. C32I]|uniref:hypothetical protein n=1 Tax=Acinetobacter sp. C32I TaxID=2950074 RepID=UPI0020368963|nr:hypothetical protein [Acinetobacter sp. C32I]USA52308.1 hypothetical protein NDN13_12555 [Acinetobacter sp. C32I]
MIEILENFEILKSSSLELDNLSLAGVKYGSDVNEFPFEKITDITLAPIVKGSSWSKAEGSRYYDENENELSKAEVINNVVQEGGVFHFYEKISFVVKNGKIREFSIYGAHKDYYSYIKNFEQFEEEFGKPEKMEITQAYGDMMNYKCFYNNGKNLVVWDVDQKAIVVILLRSDLVSK